MGSTFQRMSVAGNVLVPVFNSGLVCVPIVVITPDIDFYSGRLDLVITTITSKRIHYSQISSFFNFVRSNIDPRTQEYLRHTHDLKTLS
jgi:hypothetical protein